MYFSLDLTTSFFVLLSHTTPNRAKKMQNQNIRFRSTEAEREHEQAARNFMRLAEYHVRKFQREDELANVVHLPTRLRVVGKQA